MSPPIERAPAAGPSPVITLLTDFGFEDYYVGAMKGVLTWLAPAARLVDLCHVVPPQDVLAGAFVLRHAAAQFPPHTVHLAVVDPGVGTERRALAARTPWGVFVAPDNGLLGLILQAGECSVRAIQNPLLRRPSISPTFHGRDLFAPAAARLACGFPFDQIGPEAADPVPHPIPPAAVDPPYITGQVIHVDHFGNLVTNIPRALLPSPQVRITLSAECIIDSLSRTYGDVPPQRPLALIGSAELLEISVRNDSAARVLRMGRGDRIRVERAQDSPSPTDTSSR